MRVATQESKAERASWRGPVQRPRPVSAFYGHGSRSGGAPAPKQKHLSVLGGGWSVLTRLLHLGKVQVKHRERRQHAMHARTAWMAWGIVPDGPVLMATIAQPLIDVLAATQPYHVGATSQPQAPG